MVSHCFVGPSRADGALADLATPDDRGFCTPSSSHGPRRPCSSPIALLGFGAVSLSIFLAYKRRVAQHNLNRWRRKAIAVIMVTLAAIVIGAITSSLLVLVQHKVFQRLLPSNGWEQLDLGNGNRLFVVFALPLVISALLVSASLFCALLGLYEMEEDREWWVRCGDGCWPSTWCGSLPTQLRSMA